MVKIDKIPNIHLKEFNIDVCPYLTYSQIQQIVNAVIKFDIWAERQQNIELLVLYHVTNIGQKNIEEIGHDTLLQSGFIDAVFSNVINIDKIYKAIEYTESTSRALSQMATMLSDRLNRNEREKLNDSSKK